MKPYLYAIILLLIPILTTAKKVITKTNTSFVFDLTNSYTKTYSEHGSISSTHTLNTYISGIEQLEYHEVRLWNGKKWKELANKKSYTSDYNRGFYSGQKVIRTQITTPTAYTLNWQKKCEYAIYCSGVYFNDAADTSVVSIALPVHLTLVINWADTIGCGTIDHSKSQMDKVTLHTFTYIKQKDVLAPDIRVLVRDTSNLTHTQAFCKSYLELIAPVLSESIPQSNWLDSLKQTSGTPNKKVRAVFEYVQKQISYIAITNGLDGLCPRPVSYSLFQKQGDCKAMALVVHQYLNYLNIPNKLAISATLSYPFKMDFPTISSGNHMVCAYLPNDTDFVVLDPTDKYCQYPQPSRHTQNTSILLLDRIHPEFKNIPVITGSIPTTINLQINAQTRDGLVTYSPKSVYEWIDRETYKNNSVLGDRLKKSMQLPNALITNISRQYDTAITYTGSIKVNRNNFLTLHNSLLINQSFLPNPARLLTPKRNYSYSPPQHVYNIEIALPPTKTYSLTTDLNKQLETDLYIYNYNATITSDNTLNITYYLQIKTCLYNTDQKTQLKQLQTILEHDFNTSITLQ